MTTERSAASGLGPAATIAVRGWAKVSPASVNEAVPKLTGNALASRAVRRLVAGRPTRRM